MKISEILSGAKPTVSLEVFPPKQWEKLEQSKNTVRALLAFQPAFISVTYGAGGTSAGFTGEIAKDILAHGGTPLSHLTCVNATAAQIDAVTDSLQSAGISNILALRGDKPKDCGDTFPGDFRYASELTAHIKSRGDFCIGGACYPEKHPESKSIESDIAHLKQKVDAGADFLTTQMFFDNALFFRFRERCLAAGIGLPVLAGIMPITAVGQIGRSVSLSGCTIPKAFSELTARYGQNPEDMRKAGIAYAVTQIRDLLESGQKHIHIYTMNKPETTAQVLAGIADLIK